MTESEIVMTVENPGPYRIWRFRHYGKSCQLVREWFQVDEWSRGWFKTKWRTWGHSVCYGADSYNMDTEFKTQEKAESAIKRHMSGIPRLRTTAMVVSSADPERNG